ncbi:actin-like ATPase domain-containing protein [Cryphonectria parasitica EP155]|uniref:Actin-like ATPase domain-containing protein n=1 Tax=Cryphonectria parasitica (strain ATCC 38755 / EP155) TaxID=660469 RepID=A0A9P4Y456_CRYP1|nr:actin-like ATPase domain-containing protein [Cryphonectria parasitica EP155]KAF3766363.1 actin-like ATPase domain-containing protein [Cryphonectria parasitica EP155]
MAAPSHTLPHRAVSSIRGGATASINTSNVTSASGDASGGSNPRTPLRAIPPMTPTFSSPSSLRAEDEVLIVELGARRVRVGFAGDAAPKASVGCGPEQARRVGDFRRWEVGYEDGWRRRGWGEEHEMWRADVRGLDLGLVGDRLERALREAYNRYLLIDSRPRRVVAVLPSGTPVPLLATMLATLFSRFHTPAVSLMSSSVACAVSAGVRSALVVDMGWAETVVTAVYEYREVQTCRSVRAGKMLVERTHDLLASALGGGQQTSSPDPPITSDSDERTERVVSFEECEDVATRLTWCKPAGRDAPSQEQEEGLPTVTEQDESEASTATPPTTAVRPSSTSIPLTSTSPPTRLDMTYNQLSIPAETTFFDSQHPPPFFDDNELPLPLLIYRTLLKLPLDVRGICMARIIFTGGCSKVLGLRGRILHEVSQLVQAHGWDPVQGKGVAAYKTNPKLRRGSRQASSDDDGPTGVPSQQDTGGGGVGGHEQDGVWVDAPSDAQQEPDPVEEQVRRRKGEKRGLQGQLRVIESLGAWSGASLLSLLKVPALAIVEREAWREQGVIGASRPGEVDQKIAQRQSMGAGGLMRSAAGANWTLGVWGYL